MSGGEAGLRANQPRNIGGAAIARSGPGSSKHGSGQESENGGLHNSGASSATVVGTIAGTVPGGELRR